MRGKTAMVLVALALVFATVAPTVQAQWKAGCSPSACPKVSTPTNLYFHIFDVFGSFPINTQKPQMDILVGGTNFPTVVTNTGTEADQNYDFNTIYGYSTAGLVEYNFIENGQPRYHPERGLAETVLIDDQKDIDCGGVQAKACVRMYVAPKDVLGGTGVPNFMPKVTFRATVAEGNVLDPDELANAPVIMAGELTYHLASKEFAGQSTPDGTPVKTPNEDGVVEYAIPLTISKNAIAKAKGFHVKIDWFQDPSHDGTQKDAFAEGYLRLVMDETYMPRLELNILNPVYIDYIHPEVAAGILLIHTAENSPLGTYDVDVRNITVKINDGTRDLHVVIIDVAGNVIFDSGGSSPVDATLQIVISQNAHVHNLHDKSAEVTYLWRYRDQNAPLGTYKITIEVQNRAHTAKATESALFVLTEEAAYGVAQDSSTITAIPVAGEDEAESSPGAGLLVILLFVGLAVFLRRRLD